MSPGGEIRDGLLRAGTYVLYNDSGSLPAQPKYLKVIGPAVKRAVPKSSATAIGTTAKRVGGASTLPAKGTITFRNTSTESPHAFMGMIRIVTLKWRIEACATQRHVERLPRRPGVTTR